MSRLLLSEAERAEARRAGFWMILTALVGIFVAGGGILSSPLNPGVWIFGVVAGVVEARILLAGLELRNFARNGKVESLEQFAEALGRIYLVRLVGALVPLTALVYLFVRICTG